jgi:EAL domain-containing protein (putative c-di-GMP-specific phosphodiesterase class I)/FixJ family two-component response regulator
MKTLLSELHVLIVDDSLAQRQYAQKICVDLGLGLIENAANGAEALTLLQQHAIDVVLIDLEMPIMDGVELIRALAEKKLSAGIIILSSKDPILISSVGTMAEADGLNVLGTFQKPLQFNLLNCCLLRFLQDLYLESINTKTESHAVNVTAEELSYALLHHEITLAYQPKLTVQGLLLRGVEALARWHHPQKGNISPGEFIPLAERHGLIDLLTRNLLEQALAQKQIWQQSGLRFHLAFNLSPLSLADEQLVEWISLLAKKYTVLPQELTLEVTENALFDELACAIRTLARLRLKGFNVAIDDYGTGFANTQQLSRVPATELKIDRSLVHRASTRPQQRDILASTADLAKTLKLTTVAEGVETWDDFTILREIGVDQVQGFYFSKPLYPNQLLAWIKSDLSKIRERCAGL